MKQMAIFLFFTLLMACTGEDIEVPSPQKEALQLSVSACDFVVNGTPGTRAVDDGNDVVFEKDDRIGIIILKGTDGTGVEADNLPYIYDGTEWKFDTETATNENNGKSVYYYDNKAAKVTYIVYYPYDVSANGAKSEADLKSRFTPKTVQDSKEAYRASDLMVWTLTNITPQKRLNVQMKHAYFSVSILNQFRYELSSKALGVKYTYNAASDVTNVVFRMGDVLYTPYQAADGSYRYILPANFKGNIDCFYTFGGTTYKKVLTIPDDASPNTRYSYTHTMEGEGYTYDGIAVGDYYCLTSTKEGGFLIPEADKSKINDFGLICIGIVFKVGTGDGDTLAEYETNKPTAIHGYAVALKDAHTERGAWGIRTNDISDIDNEDGIHITPSPSNKYSGYKNTKNVRKQPEYAGTNMNAPLANSQYWAFKVASDYSVTTPPESSGWYLPSIQQLKDCNDDTITSRLEAAGGTDFKRGNGNIDTPNPDPNHYWSSNEKNQYDAWYYLFGGDGKAHSYAKSNNRELGSTDMNDWLNTSKSYVRAVLTF